MSMLSKRVSQKSRGKSSLERQLARANVRIEKLKMGDRLKREKHGLRHVQGKVSRLLYDTVMGVLEDK